MARDYPRSQRVAEQLQRELADIIRTGVKDPRLGMVTLTEVVLTRDLESAKIYFTILDTQPQAIQAMSILNRAVGFIRAQLGPRMRLRIVPQLSFVYDTSVARGAYMSNLIDEAMAQTVPQDDITQTAIKDDSSRD